MLGIDDNIAALFYEDGRHVVYYGVIVTPVIDPGKRASNNKNAIKVAMDDPEARVRVKWYEKVKPKDVAEPEAKAKGKAEAKGKSKDRGKSKDKDKSKDRGKSKDKDKSKANAPITVVRDPDKKRLLLTMPVFNDFREVVKVAEQVITPVRIVKSEDGVHYLLDTLDELYCQRLLLKHSVHQSENSTVDREVRNFEECRSLFSR